MLNLQYLLYFLKLSGNFVGNTLGLPYASFTVYVCPIVSFIDLKYENKMARMRSENYHLLSLQHTDSSKKGTRADRKHFFVRTVFSTRISYFFHLSENYIKNVRCNTIWLVKLLM